MSSPAFRVEDHPAPHRGAIPARRLLSAVFGAPFAWSVQLLYTYAGMAHACFPRREPLQAISTSAWWWSALAVSLAALIVGLISLTTSVRAWRLTREEKAGGAWAALEIGEGRTRFMAMSGILLGTVFVLAILFSGAALVAMAPCGR